MRAHHCFYCDACVAKQDHHSMWTNSCIGMLGLSVHTWGKDRWLWSSVQVFWVDAAVWHTNLEYTYIQYIIWTVEVALSSCCIPVYLSCVMDKVSLHPGARNHAYFILFLFSLALMGAWMFYGCFVCKWHDDQCETALLVRVQQQQHTRTLLCVSFFSDWSTHCPLHYEEEGLWGVVSNLVSCSPWLLCIFVLSFYHTCWSSLSLVFQLYQVTARLLGLLALV